MSISSEGNSSLSPVPVSLSPTPTIRQYFLEGVTFAEGKENAPEGHGDQQGGGVPGHSHRLGMATLEDAGPTEAEWMPNSTFHQCFSSLSIVRDACANQEEKERWIQDQSRAEIGAARTDAANMQFPKKLMSRIQDCLKQCNSLVTPAIQAKREVLKEPKALAGSRNKQLNVKNREINIYIPIAKNNKSSTLTPRVKAEERDQPHWWKIPVAGGVGLLHVKLEKAKNDENRTQGKANPQEKQPKEEILKVPVGPGPYFYISRSNGARLILSYSPPLSSSDQQVHLAAVLMNASHLIPHPGPPGHISIYCQQRGWQGIYDNTRDYALKWCESKCQETYYHFKEGEQLPYQIPNNGVLTSKTGLLCCLREQEQVINTISRNPNSKLLKREEFFPEYLCLDLKNERNAFFALCKGMVGFMAKVLKSCSHRYIQQPLLLEGKKSDVRSYLLIACKAPYLLFFAQGYVRLTCVNYDAASDDLTVHLTNQYMQKKNSLYSQLKDETIWRREHFNSYVNEKFRKSKGLSKDWDFTVFTKRMKQIILQCFLAAKHKLDRKLGYLDLIGCDFLIDENFKVWLLKVNANPALHTNCEVLKDIIPAIVYESLGKLETSSPPHPSSFRQHQCSGHPITASSFPHMDLKILNKYLKDHRILPLETLCHFGLLYHEDDADLSQKQPLKLQSGLHKGQYMRPHTHTAPAWPKCWRTLPRSLVELERLPCWPERNISTLLTIPHVWLFDWHRNPPKPLQSKRVFTSSEDRKLE
ncbi:LOW QUALITY PROTEIN: inactive polyglycylase TTLL10 [Guaruba guarouba]